MSRHWWMRTHTRNKILVTKPDVERPLTRPSNRWQCSIKMDLRETEHDNVRWIRVGGAAGCCEHGDEHSDSVKVDDS
jgi:hypothetical protein